MQASEFAVPFVDLYAQYLTIKDEIDVAIRDVIRSSAFIRGPYVDDFEQAFAQAIGRRYCVSCANGTDSLYIALTALGVRAGDEVVVPAHSWISTSETVTQAGATVVFCDTDPDTFTMDPRALEAAITDRTVGVIPVHLFGQAADMDPIMRIASRRGLWVLEDCAQAHLARYKGRMVGTFGRVASFSFYPGKNLGAMGDAGALLTDDEALMRKMASFARHGGLFKGDHQIEGVNSRMDGLQAAILSVKLKHLAAWTTARRERAEAYSRALAGSSTVIPPVIGDGRDHVWHLYVVKHERRDELARYLAQKGIQTVVNYPVALPFLAAYARLGHSPSDFPNAYWNQSRILSLPLFPEMTAEQAGLVVQCLHEFDDLEVASSRERSQ